MARSDLAAVPYGHLVVQMNSHAGWVRGVCALAAEVGLSVGLPPARAEGVATATREACLNAIEHGNAGAAAEQVIVRFEPTADRLTITVEDAGPRFEPPGEPPQLEQQLDGAAPARGWGFALMRHLSDRVEVGPRPSPSRGNAVRLVFLRGRAAADGAGVTGG